MADTLEAHLAAAARKVSTWVENEKSSLEETKQICAVEMEKDRQQLQNLVAKKEQLAVASSSREAARTENLRAIQSSQSEVRHLQAELSTSEPVVLGLREQKAAHDNKLSTLSLEASQAAQTHSLCVAELLKCIDMYQKLGLVIDAKGDKNISFVFTHIDPNAPRREFSFSLRVRPDNDLFAVDSSSPAIPSLGNLVEQLNSTGDLSAFVRAMRRQFQHTVVVS
ncbi:hypothetical protein H310_09126 [Aphanomyces invadans]|uniref:Kinetochore protein SPC25 n=1 Tax=Aphanomyces invadans TaxID=157072 RepID=A0A024TUR5_9STRA|nr:hypothetical protein H310_09126 [Aphanomyces invadans]ETV97773.1 hypothetical protein H310_09126 [Aphanomyces invadans]|eukprot:XP_008873334.1 hypothetical protein H310_09126 [Aphanomyces invadans]